MPSAPLAKQSKHNAACLISYLASNPTVNLNMAQIASS